MKDNLRLLRNLCISIIDWVHQFFPKIPTETFRYGATGGFNTLLDIFLYFICYNFILGKNNIDLYFIVVSPYIAAFLIVFPITFSTGFMFAKFITFTKSELRVRIQLFRYILSVLGAIALNYLFLKIFVEFFNMWPTIAKIFTTIIVVAYSYMVQRYFTFKTGKIINKKNKF